MDMLASLKKTSLFRDFPDEELTKLAACAEEYNLAPGSTLFNEGDKAEEFFVLVMGTVKVLKKNREGNQEEVAVLGTGSYFGEVEYVSEQEERVASIQAQEPSHIVGLRHAAVRKLVNEDRSLGFHLYRAMARGLASRLGKTTKDTAYFKAIALRHE